MDRFITPMSAEYIDGRHDSPILEGYNSTGAYLNFHKLRVPNWAIVTIDDHGIPKNSQGGGEHYNPVTIAHYGLELASQHILELADRRDDLSKVVRYAIQAQNNDGGWPFTFDHLFFVDRVAIMPAGWYSALSQGMMISVFARWVGAIDREKLISHDVIRRSVELSAEIIGLDVEHGGVRRTVFDGLDFYEEYPTTPASFVLNGFMFCLLGLYDGYTVFGSTACRELFESGIKTLRRTIPMYDIGDGSTYDLTHFSTAIEGPSQARASYHRLHITLLAALSSITDGAFARVVERWDKYLMGNRLRTN